jgi:hypothetical protein
MRSVACFMRACTTGKAIYRVLVLAVTAIGGSYFLTSTCTGEPYRSRWRGQTATHELKALEDLTCPRIFGPAIS